MWHVFLSCLSICPLDPNLCLFRIGPSFITADLTNKLFVDTKVSAVELSLNEEITRSTKADTDLENLLTNSIDTLEEDFASKLSTKADLVDGKIPNSQLPDTHKASSVFEYESPELFPEIGLEGSLYISTSDNVIYRWNGTEYVALSSAGFKEDTTINIICEV